MCNLTSGKYIAFSIKFAVTCELTTVEYYTEFVGVCCLLIVSLAGLACFVEWMSLDVDLGWFSITFRVKIYYSHSL